MPAQELELSLGVGGHGRFEAKEGPDQVWVLERSWAGVGDGLLRREWIRGAGKGWELAKKGASGVQREWRSIRCADLCGGRSSLGVSRLANAVWPRATQFPFLGLSPLICTED